MFTLDSVTCADRFPADGAAGGAQLIASNGSNGGFFTIANNDVYVSLGYQPAQGGGVSIAWTPEVHVGPGNGILQRGTCGIRFRNYTAGAPAIVSAGLSEPAEPALQLSAGGVAGTAAGAMRLIENKILTANVAAVTFSAIPQTYQHLQLVVRARSNGAVQPITMTVNGLAANYIWQEYYAQAATNNPSEPAGLDVSARIGYLGASTGLGSTLDILFPSYASAAFGMQWHSDWHMNNNNAIGNSRRGFHSGGVFSLGPAATLTLAVPAAAFQAGSVFTLYGLGLG